MNLVHVHGEPLPDLEIGCTDQISSLKLHERTEQIQLGRDSVMVIDRSGEPPIEKVQTVEKGGD